MKLLTNTGNVNVLVKIKAQFQIHLTRQLYIMCSL